MLRSRTQRREEPLGVQVPDPISVAVALDTLADPERLAQLDLTVLHD